MKSYSSQSLNIHGVHGRRYWLGGSGSRSVDGPLRPSLRRPCQLMASFPSDRGAAHADHAFPGASVLDVGGGHGQVARPLIQDGHNVTVLASPHVAIRGQPFASGRRDAKRQPERSALSVQAFRRRHFLWNPRPYRNLEKLSRRALPCRPQGKAVIVDFSIPSD